jgi:hypothetical protein
MKKFIAITIFALGSVSASWASHTVAPAESCMSIQPVGANQKRISNSCSENVQVEVRDPQGDREMLFVNGNSSQLTGTGGNGQIRIFSCPTPAYPSQISSGPSPVQFSTQTYYCVANY